MSSFRRVVWTEGMFLQPQHFQQQDRHIERWVDQRLSTTAAYRWGWVEYELDDASLMLGRVQLLKVRGVLPDGTPIDAPALDPLPAAFDFPVDIKDQVVVLAVPSRRPTAQEAGMEDEDDAALLRYIARDVQVQDASAGFDNTADIQVGDLHARLMLQRDATEAYQSVGVVRIVERKADNQLLVDRGYIPPMLAVAGHARLAGYAREVQALMAQRGEALAARMGKPGAGGVAEIADFLMLQTVNRYEPLFTHLSKLYLVHPELLYRTCLEAAGDLAIFGNPTRRPRQMPDYLHEDLERSFGAVVAELRALLGTVLEQRAIAIDLVDRKYGVRTASIADLELMKSANFVLAVNAQVPGEQLRTRFPSQVKLGPVDKIRDLVNLQLPGITLRGLAVAPRELPYHAGFHYFELERHGDLWEQLKKSGAMAMHIAGEFPGLQLEFWAIRER
ncbi:type VI secretion system baseplate subunit TssK [Aquabacterium sp. A7-Y]|uniref:type VI secretion system baseplate subunit TssK n=1 Tax=Aquabacterium sp. A7-Y TaxID=1349605 RepID=UPI00223CF7AD|nr:type VI secretion system baseplate subunit TssK [Aquabacterium sp. A7-Y]MCW7540740.1 type VI secretion system baseplate subunit TssK [Aquabacterium sp. A7-Y]